MNEESGDWTELLQLADGSSGACRTAVGEKGIPEAQVKAKGGDIDLLPMYWLIDRWCKVAWDNSCVLTTPKGYAMHLEFSDGMPYLTYSSAGQASFL